MKLKKCKVCKKGFQPTQPLQTACSLQCALKVGKKKVQRQRQKETRERKRKLLDSDRSHWLKVAQTAFNQFVRERDKMEPCISCGRHHDGQYHAGHFRTVGAHPELRFHPFNNNKQCAPCNNHKSGDIVNYRANLKVKIGEDNLNWLEGYHEPVKWTIDDLKEIKAYYMEQLKILKSMDSFDRWTDGL